MKRLVAVFLCALFMGVASVGLAEAASHVAITGAVDDDVRVTLAGNTRPEAVAVNDAGTLDPTRVLHHMELQLKRLPADEREVEAYVDGLNVKGSPSFHQWLNPAEFGRRFGVADEDLAKVTGWLKARGFTVDFVYPSHMLIAFSGPVSAVDAAFSADMHRLSVGGQSHIANMRDPQIPAALANVVAGVVSLHDFRHHGYVQHRPRDTGPCDGTTCYAFAPGDLATIYDLTPLFQNGIAGQGEVIAAVEATNLYSNNDFATFRSVFQLNRYTAGRFSVQHPAAAGGAACANPGVDIGNSDGEATLDVEWATAAAPAATILLASCASSDTADGVDIAAQNLINASTRPDIISYSYGTCEVTNGAAANAANNSLFQQAAAESIGVFVATGDDGPTDCITASPSPPTRFGIGVNGAAVTQYNVAVGGTDFADVYSNDVAAYWGPNKGAPYSTALSYIPEIPWNNTCASTLLARYSGYALTYGAGGFCNSKIGAQYLDLDGGEGGPSSCYSGAASIANVVSGTCKGYPKPSWQKLVGVPADGVRDVPDVALFASNGNAWGVALATCFTDPTGGGGGPCTGNPVTWVGNAGGTSYATPIMAGIQALINQGTGFVGNPAPIYYQLAAKSYGAAGNKSCYATQGANVGASCVFHDVVAGDDDTPCLGKYNCYLPSGTYGVLSTSSTAYKPAFAAGVGYDFPTGIGSVDATNLYNAWPAQ